MSKQKAKGGAYERDVAERLTKTYGVKFMRNISGSGAFIGGKNIFRREQLDESTIRHVKGDVVAPVEFSKLNIECKNYAATAFSFHLLLTGEHKLLDTWLKQMLAVASSDDCSVLFFKLTRVGQWVAVQDHYTWNLSSYVHYKSKNHGSWYICELNDFFELNSELLRKYSAPTQVTSD